MTKVLASGALRPSPETKLSIALALVTSTLP